ncbi:MAG: T9SS type A sorting domain-containing protein [Bacteroidales bacterium]|nr:T9SS type A sorting domain-containing protein [Bacteroidales bacterium]
MSQISSRVSVSSLRGKELEIVLSPVTLEWFISCGYEYTVCSDTVPKGVFMASSVGQALEWETYPTYIQYDSIMRSFASLYPALCVLDTIGTSNYGKLVLALKISDNASVDEDEPEVFYSSTMHGDETGGFILMLRLAGYLLQNYTTDSRIKNLADNLEIWINPLANPDGTYRTGNIISSPTRFNANGYDLNRNFPDPVDDDPAKQLETLDMMKFMKEHHFVLSANFHAGVEVVNYPWDRWERRHPDEEWFYRISRKYADTVHSHAVAGYMTFMENGVTNGWDWYYVYGGRQDYVTWELRGRELTIELDDTKLTPASNLNALWEYNYRSLLDYLENALAGVHGQVTDIYSGDPVAAQILIPGHDADNSDVFSDTLTGSFIRFLPAGAWTLQFTAEGYKSKTVTVDVINDVSQWIDVRMEPLFNPVDTIRRNTLFIYPNPADSYMKVVLPEWHTGVVKVEIYGSAGQKLTRFYDTADRNIPLTINVGNLPGGVYYISVTSVDTQVSDRAKFIVVRRN